MSLSIAIQEKKFVAHAQVGVSVLGMTVSGDLLISNRGLVVVVEGNIWDIFLATVEMSVDIHYLNRKWYGLTFSLKGSFLAASERKTTTTGRNNDFNGSYLDGLIMFARKIADEANRRLTSAQNSLSSAQRLLTRAQGKLSHAQDNVRKFHSSFDVAVNKLGDAKKRLMKPKFHLKRHLQHCVMLREILITYVR